MGYYGKRDAEAEPEADADALYSTYGYGLGYSAYSRPVYGGYSTYSRPIVSSYARPVVSSIGYSAYSRPVYGGYSSYYGRETLRLNLRLMLFTAPMDMVLDLSTEDTPPTPDQLFPPLDTLPTLDQSMEDTPEVSMDSTKPAFYQ